MRVGVLGWSPLNIGPALAADLAHAGHEVRFAAWPDAAPRIEALRRTGLSLAGGTAHTVSSAAGPAPVAEIGDDLVGVARWAEILLLDIHPPELEVRFPALLPGLKPGAVVQVNSHGYWPALRLRPILKEAGLRDVLVVEGPTPLMAAGLTPEGLVEPHVLRRRIPVATFPGRRTAEALTVLRRLYPDLEGGESVLHLALENMNLMVHPGLALANLAAFDRAEAAGRGFGFYTEGNTPVAGAISDALDEERRAICGLYRVPARPVTERLAHLYGAHGANFHEAVRNCAWLTGLGDLPAQIWRRWLSVDIPYAIVPAVRLAEATDNIAPRHRALAEILGPLLGIDPWREGLTLERLGLVGMTPDVMRNFVERGDDA